MDSLLESLETLLDDLGNPDYEVEYHAIDGWLYSRDNQALGDLLNKELTMALGQPVDIALQGPAL
ncbi:hypothetical protein H0H87_005874 [Tephrocybe sp. NHM501043]|nr:hypothetical protein H0H87_005874 [Tephrocybe sp. NHM501043]